MEEGKIFLVKDSGELAELNATPFDDEALLQEYIYKYPEIIPGGQINPEDPRRWLIVSREKGMPTKEAGTDRFWLDILSVDQDGILTLVECKRCSDTRIRRQVVAQMVEYAANGSAYWPLNSLVKAAEEAAESRGSNLTEDLTTLLGNDDPEMAESFWQNVSENISAGKLRLIFAADALPTELIRMIEFLNEQMERTEVLGVEIKQYEGASEKLTVLVPRVLGFSVKSREKKTVKTNEVEFLSNCSDAAREFFEYLFGKITGGDFVIYWGVSGFSVRLPIRIDGKLCSFLYGFPPNEFQVYLYTDIRMEPSKKAEIRKYLIGNGFTKSGEYTLKGFITEGNIGNFNEVADYVIGEFLKTLE